MPEKTIKVCKVTPPPGSPTDICLPLTFFDLLWLRYSPPEMLFFYELPFPELLISKSIISRLEHSLSKTLRHFLPVAGNITWPTFSPKPVIIYKESDGVALTVVVSNDDFHYLSGKNIRECRSFLPLVARIVGSHSQVPILALKFTIFPNQGFCIGFTAHHGVLDAKSIALFMKLWASMSKFGGKKTVLNRELTPVFDRKLVREQYADMENSYIGILKRNEFAQNSLETRKFESILLDRVRGTFTLSGLDVRKLKQVECDRVSIPYISTFTATYAYVTLCIVRAKEQTKDSRVFLGFPVDIRSRLEPHLPANYFGNCVTFCDAIIDRKELMGKEGITPIVNFISESIRSLENDVLNKIKQSLSNALKERNPNDTKATRVYVVGSSKFGFEQIDFGWGMPKKVDIIQVDKMSAVTFTELGDGSVEVELSLNKDEMERFSYQFTRGLDNMMKHRFAAL